MEPCDFYGMQAQISASECSKKFLRNWMNEWQQNESLFVGRTYTVCDDVFSLSLATVRQWLI